MAFAAVYAKCFVFCPKDKALLEMELSKWERKSEKQLAITGLGGTRLVDRYLIPLDCLVQGDVCLVGECFW